MSNKTKQNKEILSKDNITQAVVVADTFGDEFVPISTDIPLALFPLINKPLIDYTLEFLSLGGIEETFLFCCSHTDTVKAHIKLIDLSDVATKDKGAAMTLIFQEAGIGQIGRDSREEVVIAVNNNKRVLYHKKLGQSRDRKITFPLDDFVKGLLINEEILGSTVYCHIAKGGNYGGAVTSWRMYQAISQELQNKWIYPLQPSILKNNLKNGVIIGNDVVIKDNKNLTKSIIGDNVAIGPNSRIKSKSKITLGSIIGKGVIIESDEKDKLGKKAFRLKIEDEDDGLGSLRKQLSRLHIDEHHQEESEEDEDAFTDSEEEELSYTQSPVPDDTKLFFTEVIDSLTRGFEDELQCDNLILEINSSRYAYNVTVKEVNFNVIKAILHMSLRLSTGPQYFSQFVRLLSYFAPILKNYIRNNSAMLDTLQAIEDVAISNENINEKWIMFVLKWFYDKDHITEDIILEWSKTLDKKSRFFQQVKPFTDWLEEAEEATSSDED
ncbi:translation initiation factor eIF-2B subunit epsilon [Asbolus verrucosus]|uniref:Translation initiation factor eIF2B subunit epsilon n=1 Tax=Asbolus verrucosus TaxID=1661398 RepID=A0A482VBY7_ASBVE|nr:translation initiation factor eIF-2B subunit epsilon [Asbolus verrucosus]